MSMRYHVQERLYSFEAMFLLLALDVQTAEVRVYFPLLSSLFSNVLIHDACRSRSTFTYVKKFLSCPAQALRTFQWLESIFTRLG